LTPGSKADFAMWNLDDMEFAGSPASALSMPEWLLARCYSGTAARHVFVDGTSVVADGRVLGVDARSLAGDAHIAATNLYRPGKEQK